jgi:UDP-2,4-diacetamido-2,4,6-trideoxy-beta-L-altropyranose hydrolase
MKIAFRVDSSKKLGLGHVKRCVPLAKSLEEKNISVLFITQFTETQNFLQSKDFIVFTIKQKSESVEINQILKKEHCTKLVIDSKRKSIENLLKNLDDKIKVILIDNFQFSNHTDLIISSSFKNPKFNYPKNSIVGPKFLLHGIENIPKFIKHKNNSILLTMGGSDKYNITQKILNSFLKNLNNFKLIIILGKYYEYEKNLFELINNDTRFIVIKNPPNLTDLMQHSSIGIVTFGITVYEAAICRLPLFVISHSDENNNSAKLVEKYGWISYLGKYDEINYDNLVKTTINLTKNKSKLKKMSQNCLKIDGLGPSRVADKIIKL